MVREMKVAESLIALFAPQPHDDGFAGLDRAKVLTGSFIPAVPFRNAPVTEKKAW